MDNIYRKLFNMGTDMMLGRVEATVVFLNHYIFESYCLGDDKIMLNILKGAEKGDVYGRICSLIGYITGEDIKSDVQKHVYEMVTGEKLEGLEDTEETKKA